jgi:hypothetical protein
MSIRIDPPIWIPGRIRPSALRSFTPADDDANDAMQCAHDPPPMEMRTSQKGSRARLPLRAMQYRSSANQIPKQ